MRKCHDPNIAKFLNNVMFCDEITFVRKSAYVKLPDIFKLLESIVMPELVGK